ncbi:MAG TPA: hypothetical protein VFG14_01335 [Chthoniobacteraceae bacterium]|nr:hypothetical protein [Chthoniobacteraceae bacterium]
MVRVCDSGSGRDRYKCASIDRSIERVVKIEEVSLKNGDAGTLPRYERVVRASHGSHAELSKKLPAGDVRDLYTDDAEPVRCKPCQIP